MNLHDQLLLQGLAAIVLRLTIVSVQRGTCAIIKVESCVYIPDLSRCISATQDDMKGQVKVTSDDNLPFRTSVLSWVKGDWWKTIFIVYIITIYYIVIVALIVLLSRCSLLCLFPPSSPLLMLLTHSMGIVLRDMPHPDSPTSSLGE